MTNTDAPAPTFETAARSVAQRAAIALLDAVREAAPGLTTRGEVNSAIATAYLSHAARSLAEVVPAAQVRPLLIAVYRAPRFAAEALNVDGLPVIEWRRVRCEGGSRDCLGYVDRAEHAADAMLDDGSNFPYCSPCRVAAHADSVLDEPEFGPLPEAPDLTAGLVDGLLADARRRDPGGHPTWWATQVERFVRRSVEVALVGLPTGGGTDRDRTADQLAHYAEALRILTRRMADGTADVRLYAEPSDDEF